MVRERKTEIRIRRARVSDAASISSVMYESFVEYKSLYTDEAFHETCPPREQVFERMKEGPLWVASLDNRIVGTVSVVGLVEGLLRFFYVQLICIEILAFNAVVRSSSSIMGQKYS